MLYSVNMLRNFQAKDGQMTLFTVSLFTVLYALLQNYRQVNFAQPNMVLFCRVWTCLTVCFVINWQHDYCMNCMHLAL